MRSLPLRLFPGVVHRPSAAVIRQPLQKKQYSTGNSRHAQWYSDIFPAMVPIFLLGSAVYLGLQLTHLKLSHEKTMEEAATRVKQLEAEIEALQAKYADQNKNTFSETKNASPKPSRWW
ncbi:hypothetical protein AMATHDRAFT_139536 [Amanita thiersii Skay4041]|uniref:Uncharacterized protein n=1 Tax=Amanita thiersii Skay4041 TaxID=703135 RepID=A0A2A9NNF5_9AGAR|nr:hypothetical protein AMATHDRAFT_139536 [Amanita thiersii Skay4041]